MQCLFNRIIRFRLKNLAFWQVRRDIFVALLRTQGVVLLCGLGFGLLACVASHRKEWVERAMKPFDGPAVWDQPTDVSHLSVVSDPSHPYLSAEFQKELDQTTSSVLTSGNVLQILPNAKSLQEKIRLIDRAQRSVLIVTYQLVCDADGVAFVKRLIAAQKRGVQVRFLISDSMMGSALAESCFKQFAKVAKAKKGSFIHDKILIVDSEYAITGGQNIAELYSKSDGLNLYFRDTDVLVKGPVVHQMALRFLQLWKRATFDKPDVWVVRYERELGRVLQGARKKQQIGSKHYETWLKKDTHQGLCRFVTHDPVFGDWGIHHAYGLLAQHAQKQIVFQVPQFNAFGSLQQERLFQTFKEASFRPEMDVKLLTFGPGYESSKALPPLVGGISGRYFLSVAYESLKGSNIQVYIHRSWVHSKVYYFDGLVVSIGSFNFDESGNTWTESTLICMDDPLTQQVRELLELDLANSRPMGVVATDH